MSYAKVLVTGGSGRLGRYVVDELLQHAAVTVFDLAPPQQAGVPHVAGDATDLEAVRAAVAGQDAILHLAALDLGVKSPPERWFGVNVMAAWNVLQAATEAGIGKVVVVSSVAADGLTEMRPEHVPRYLPVDEDHPLAPVHPYGVSKLVVEDVCRAFARRGDIEVTCLRPTVVAFPWHVPVMLERVRSGMRWFASYVTPEDTAVACRLALDYHAAPFDVFYLNAADACVDEPSLERAEALFGAVPRLRDPAWYEADPRAAFIDSPRAQAALGWRPTSSWPGLVREHGGG